MSVGLREECKESKESAVQIAVGLQLQVIKTVKNIRVWTV
jgi:hypothetical protein